MGRLPGGRGGFIVVRLVNDRVECDSHAPPSFGKVSGPRRSGQAGRCSAALLCASRLLHSVCACTGSRLGLRIVVCYSSRKRGVRQDRITDGGVACSVIQVPFFVCLSPTCAQLCPSATRTLHRGRRGMFAGSLVCSAVDKILRLPGASCRPGFSLDDDTCSLGPTSTEAGCKR